MKNGILVTALTLVVVGIVGVMAAQMIGDTNPGKGRTATIYKSPTCGCCGQYSVYLGKEGYDVVIENVEDMSEVKRSRGVPYELESCHTMEVAEYVVEGHVPREAIEKLLAEKPDIKGIGMAGMPSGSPGMPGPKVNDFVVYEITHEGTKGAIFMTL